MRRLMVQIEVNGTCKYVGDITEKDFGKAYFTYADEYLSDSGSRPISISLPKSPRRRGYTYSRLYKKSG